MQGSALKAGTQGDHVRVGLAVATVVVVLLGGGALVKGAGGAVASARDLASWARRLAGGAVLRPRTVRTFYEILAQPERLPRGNRFVVGYGGANDYGFNSVVVEADRARRLVVALTNTDKNRAEKLANRIAPLVIP